MILNLESYFENSANPDQEFTVLSFYISPWFFVCVDALHPSQQFFSYVGTAKSMAVHGIMKLRKLVI